MKTVLSINDSSNKVKSYTFTGTLPLVPINSKKFTLCKYSNEFEEYCCLQLFHL